jgi:two-component system OmpR family sensor kinase
MSSFRTRLALAHVCAIVVVLIIATAGSYWVFSRLVHDELDAALLVIATAERAALASSSDGPVFIRAPQSETGPFSYARLDRLIQISDFRGEVVARSSNLGAARLPMSTASLKRLHAGETVFETFAEFGDEPTRMVAVPVRARGSLWIVQVAGSLDDVNSVVATAAWLFSATGAALLVAVGIAGALLTRKALRAIDGVVHRAQAIGDGNLAERLPHPGTNDEIGRLVETLNEMLDRLERSFESERRFTADASHELRSPLSRLRTELEIALRRSRTPAEYVETLESCLDEVVHLTKLVEELLALARLDSGQERPGLEAITLHQLTREAASRLEITARQRNVQVEIEAAAPSARVSHPAACLVLINLLDNAVKYTPLGGRVMVRAHAEGASAVVTVHDSGPGISPDELPHLFERFRRGPGHARSTQGSGLGLALSQAVARAHGGSISASNDPNGGACFTVTLPLVP